MTSPQAGGQPPLRLDPAFTEMLRTETPEIAASVLSAITDTIPEYRSLDPAGREAVRRTAHAAITSFVNHLEAGTPPGDASDAGWTPGTGAWRSGRSLDGLQAAFGVAARAAWDRIAQTAVKAGMDAETVGRLAGALFAGVERVAARATESYARAQAEAAGQREADRARLVFLLIRDPPVSGDALRGAADRAGWRMPKRLAAIALGDADDPRVLASRIGPDALSSDAAHCVLVPDPDGPMRRETIDRACARCVAAVGPSVVPEDALRTLAWARETLALLFAGKLDATPPPRAEDNLLALALARGSDLIDALAARHGLLDATMADSRIDLCGTLLTWLQRDRSATAAAEILQLHPQTVRYRISRAREVLGAALDDPLTRFELETVLYARRYAGDR